MAFEIAVFGTSVLWGQGLREEDKIQSVVKRMLEKRKLCGDQEIMISLLAHSGAQIEFKEDDIQAVFKSIRVLTLADSE